MELRERHAARRQDSAATKQARDRAGRRWSSGSRPAARSLEESLALWERGEKLADICQRWLDGARERDSTRPASARAAAEASGVAQSGERTAVQLGRRCLARDDTVRVCLVQQCRSRGCRRHLQVSVGVGRCAPTSSPRPTRPGSALRRLNALDATEAVSLVRATYSRPQARSCARHRPGPTCVLPAPRSGAMPDRLQARCP